MNKIAPDTQSTQHLPAEWSLQSAVMFSWPHTAMDWSSEELVRVQNALMDMIEIIAKTQTVFIVANDNTVSENILSLLEQRQVPTHSVEVFQAKNNDAWIRDFGPIVIYENNQPTLIDFQFNGWGEKFPYENDNALTTALSKSDLFKNIPIVKSPLHIEGGGIESDGQGTLLATTRCLLNDNRQNPDQAELETELKKLLGLKRILWLENSELTGDDTDGHVDMLARFINPYTIAYAQCLQPDLPHYASLKAMAEELESFKQLNGEPYQLVPIPLPHQSGKNTLEHLPQTYLNFLVTNEHVFVPQYNVPEDKPTLALMQTLFRDKHVLGIDTSALIEQGGGLHCATMHVPQLQ